MTVGPTTATHTHTPLQKWHLAPACRLANDSSLEIMRFELIIFYYPLSLQSLHPLVDYSGLPLVVTVSQHHCYTDVCLRLRASSRASMASRSTRRTISDFRDSASNESPPNLKSSWGEPVTGIQNYTQDTQGGQRGTTFFEQPFWRDAPKYIKHMCRACCISSGTWNASEIFSWKSLALIILEHSRSALCWPRGAYVYAIHKFFTAFLYPILLSWFMAPWIELAEWLRHKPNGSRNDQGPRDFLTASNSSGGFRYFGPFSWWKICFPIATQPTSMPKALWTREQFANSMVFDHWSHSGTSTVFANVCVSVHTLLHTYAWDMHTCTHAYRQVNQQTYTALVHLRIHAYIYCRYLHTYIN